MCKSVPNARGQKVTYFSGADVLFIGPYDLSISLGFRPPNPDPHPEVETIIQQILKISHDAGKKWFVCSHHLRFIENMTGPLIVLYIAAQALNRPSARQKALIWLVRVLI